MIDPLRCRAWLPLLPLPDRTVGAVNGIPLTRDAFELHYDETDVAKFADFCLPCPPRVERRARRSAMFATVNDELLRQRAETLGVEYDAEHLALREQRADRGLDRDAPSGKQRPFWRNRVIAELRFAAIRHAEGLRPPSDAELANALAGMFADFLRPPGVALAEITVADIHEAHRLRALASAPGADFAELARQHSCSRTALAGGSLGVVPVRSRDGHDARALAVGELGPPIAVHEPGLGKCWRILRCIARGSADELCADSPTLDCVRESLMHTLTNSGRTEALWHLRRSATIVDHVDPTMTSAVIRIELPAVVAEVAGLEIPREALLAEIEPRVRSKLARDDQTIWEGELRYWLLSRLRDLVARTRLVHEAVTRGVLASTEAESMCRPPLDASGDDRTADEVHTAWSRQVAHALEGMLLPRKTPEDDRPWIDPEDATRKLHAELTSRHAARYFLAEEPLDDYNIEEALDDELDAMRELVEIRAECDGAL